MPLFSKKSQGESLERLGLDALLFLADTKEDPMEIHEALLQAERLAPENLDIQRRLLLMGRLHERNPKKLDFHVIKSYLLHAFEHPEEHPQGELEKMSRELFDEPRLQRCLELAQDPKDFLKRYLEDLSRDYMRIFVAADNRHVPRVFGLSFKGNLQKYLAKPASDIISNILSSPYLNEEEAILLASAFYRAFFEYAQGEVRELDSLLGAQICAQLR